MLCSVPRGQARIVFDHSITNGAQNCVFRTCWIHLHFCVLFQVPVLAKLYFGHTLTPSLPQIWAELLNSYYLTFGNGLVRHLARSLPQFWAEFLNWSRNYNFRSPTISIFFSGECGSHCNIHLCHFLPKFVAIFLSQICSHYLPIFEGILPPDWSNFVRSHFTVKFQADLSPISWSLPMYLEFRSRFYTILPPSFKKMFKPNILQNKTCFEYFNKVIK